VTDDLDEAAAYCPVCLAEYRAGFDVCADDGTPLLSGPAPAPEEETEEPERPRIQTGARWQKLADIGTEERARLLAGRLESEGIPVTLSPDRLYEFYGPGTGSFLGKAIEVYVPEDQILRARQVIEELERT
jgi:hypothetical protein